MAKMRNILKHVRAIRNIRTVTNAMQTVASARFKAAYGRIASFTPFSTELLAMTAALIADTGPEVARHPLVRGPGRVGREVLLMLTSDRGLCGAYNRGVLQLGIGRMKQLREAGYSLELHVVGKRGVRYLEFRGLRIDRVHDQFGDAPGYRAVAALADSMMSRFLRGQISGLEVAYAQFAASGRQHPAIAPVLPLSDLPSPKGPTDPDRQRALLCEFLPSPEAILRRLLPVTVRLKLYQCFLDAAAAEQFTRRTAMQAATDNADDMIHELSILANRQRQKQITTELSEIMGGRAGLEG